MSSSEKLKLVIEFGSHKNNCDEFKVPASTLCRILKNKDTIKSRYIEGQGNLKIQRLPDNVELEKCLVKWLKQCLDNNIPVSGHSIKGKAKEYATKLNIDDFCASNGQIEDFKSRNDLAFKEICGESKAVDESICNQWIEDLFL